MDILSYILGMKAGEKASGDSGSSGNVSTGEVKMYSKSFEATAKQMEVEHIAGEVPDILAITIADIPTSGVVFMALGFSQALVEKLGEEYVNEVTFLAASGGAMRISSNVGIDMPQTQSLYINCGGIRDVTDKKFTIGGSQYGLNVGDYYTYRAICGLV